MTKNIKPTIVILPGWCMPARAYEPLLQALRQLNIQVTAIDLPGFGIDPPTFAWGVTEYVRFVRDYITKHHLSNIIFLGHSFGGRVALKYSFLYPKEVRLLIFTGTPGYSAIPTAKKALIRWIAKFGSHVLEHLPITEYRTSIQRMFYFAFGVRDFVKAKGIMQDVFKTIVDEPLDKYMQAVRVPCLLLWGQNDGVVPVAIATRMKETIQNAQLEVVSNENHALPYKNPTAVSAYVKQFIEIS